MRCAPRLFAWTLLASLLAASAPAQFGGGGTGGGGGGLGGGGGTGGGIGGGGGTQGTGSTSGVAVDAQGVLRTVGATAQDAQLAQRRIAESMALLDGDLKKPSKLRKVSLTRLEKALREKLAAGAGPDDAMKALAGLTRVEYVFAYPETGEVVLAGPAEPWATAPDGRVRGVATGRPVVELQDLAVALRAFAGGPSGEAPLIYCSIDPTPEGLQRMQQFLAGFSRTNSGPMPGQAETQLFIKRLSESLGPQVITVGGVSPKTHFAQVLVEADYRMKLIGIGLERPPVRLASYVDRANPAAVARNAMQRWYFVPDYECVRRSEDGLAMQLVGEGVKLIGEDEFVSSSGERKASGLSNGASQGFVAAFTKMYPKLAERSPVYAQMRNCIDLAVAAAYIQQHDLLGQVGAELGVLGDEAQLPCETLNAPQQVASAVNAIRKGSTLMTPIGGGVQIRATEALDDQNLLADEAGLVSAKRAEVQQATPAGDAWWWD